MTQVEFDVLYFKWYNDIGGYSTVYHMVNNKYFKEIVALGDDAIPLILNCLRKRSSFIFYALEEITNEKPVKREHIGHVNLQIKDWLEWGVNKGFIKSIDD